MFNMDAAPGKKTHGSESDFSLEGDEKVILDHLAQNVGSMMADLEDGNASRVRSRISIALQQINKLRGLDN